YISDWIRINLDVKIISLYIFALTCSWQKQVMTHEQAVYVNTSTASCCAVDILHEQTLTDSPE
ncbi:hypothetical protein, partial [Klebsiella variicola]